ncbi:hypothetical protein WJX81_006447 [Elliptochloris bilobata]|uniref:Zinc-finger domain-containing protein n=1 Tax=Elliptochloris bilobata TaxID=381761 RepID=A0AAW1SC55_9CHLO
MEDANAREAEVDMEIDEGGGVPLGGLVRAPVAPRGRAAAGGGRAAPITILVASSTVQGSQEGVRAFPQLLFGAVGSFRLPKGLRLAGASLLHAPDVVPTGPQAASDSPAEGLPGRAARLAPYDGAPYDSPLKAFGGYRLCPTYGSVSRLPLASATYAHALDPDWPLCKFEARGACRDARCQFQMARDYALTAGGVLRSLHALARRGGSRAPMPPPPYPAAPEALEAFAAALLAGAARQIPIRGPAAGPGSGSGPMFHRPAIPAHAPGFVAPSAKQSRVAKLARRVLAVEATVPEYALPPAIGRSLGFPRRRLFRSVFLAPAMAPTPLPWWLMGAWEGFAPPAAITPTQPAAPAAPAPVNNGGRYFSGTSQAVGATLDAGEAQELAWAAAAKAAVDAAPRDVGRCLAYALQHVDFGSAGAASEGALVAALRVLASALEAAPLDARLWAVYLPLYALRAGSPGEAAAMAEAALRYAGSSHRLWLIAAHQRQHWRDRASLLQRGILALAAAAPADAARGGPNPDPVQIGAGSGLTWAAAAGAAAPNGAAARGALGLRDQNPNGNRGDGAFASLRADQVLDLGLRLMHLLGGACRNGALGTWVAALAADADAGAGRPGSATADAARLDARQLAAAARVALLRTLNPDPPAAAALWLAAAHASAWGRLPDPIVHRLGFRQIPPASLTWHAAPPASTSGRVRAALAAAACAVGLLDGAPADVAEAADTIAARSAVPLAGAAAVRAAFAALLAPPAEQARPAVDDDDMEEGEIASAGAKPGSVWGVRVWGPQELAATTLNLAMYEALSGDGAAALAAAEAALSTAGAAGCDLLQEHVWQEFLALAAATMLREVVPDDNPNPDPPLEPAEEVALDARVQRVLGAPPARDDAPLAAALLAVLPQLRTAEAIALLEELAAAAPASPALAAAAVEAAAARGGDARWGAWALPLAAGLLAAAMPTPAPHIWLRAVVLTERHSPAAAAELCAAARARLPHSTALGDRALALAAARGPAERAAVAAALEAQGVEP